MSLSSFDYGQELVETPEELDALFEKVEVAFQAFRQLDQAQVDKIFYAAAFAASNQRIPLAKMAYEETGMGLVEDKVIKNMFGSEYVYNKYKNMKTAGVIEEDKAGNTITVAEPLGILAGIVPTTNPTSTAIFKCLIALKTRNCIIFSPHHRATKSTIHAARIVRDAAVKAGAPPNCIAWITKPSVSLAKALMGHRKTSCVLATGGPGMVTSAYSSGNPSIGVGPGNVPALIDETCDYRTAVNQVINSKSFDNGVVCASEQAIVCVTKEVYDKCIGELKFRGAYVMTESEKQLVNKLIMPINEATGKHQLNPDIVGRPARVIAETAGVTVPADCKCRCIVGTFTEVSHSEAMSCEKLSPVLGICWADTFEKAVDICGQMIDMAGAGHTAAIHTAPDRRDRIDYFTHHINAGRIVVNSPSTFGGIGDLYNFAIDPTMTIGCGSYGKNSVSENVGPKHLLNYKKVAIVRRNPLWFKVPQVMHVGEGALAKAAEDLISRGLCRAYIITGKAMHDLGFTDKIIGPLTAGNFAIKVFTDVLPDPDLGTCYRSLAEVRDFQPDTIIALGGGSAMDLAKMVRLLYEHPNVDFAALAQRFMDIRKRIYEYPECLDLRTTKTFSVAIPTTSGTGSEVTPFSVITDEKEHVKYPLADYQLMTHMAVIDPELVLTVPASLASWTGVDALTHAIESYVSTLATEYTMPLSLQAIKMVFENLESSVVSRCPTARGNMHQAATIAGIAFANAFLGICHSCAHKLGQKYHIPHGLANAIMLPHVIRYNAVNDPVKIATFPQYLYPVALERYAEIADYCGFTNRNDGKSVEEKMEILIKKIYDLYGKVGINAKISACQEAPVEADFFAEENLEYLAYHSFDDQCTGANPRYPLIDDFKELFRAAW